MSLTLITTPIGNLEDISLRALKTLKNTKIIIGEEAKTLRRRLSAWEIPPREKEIYELNEHSKSEDIEELLEICRIKDVALVTDCGTPSFFDPGFQLVKACKEEKVEIISLPGVSSLTALMPFLDRRTERFNVAGFPPRDNEERKVFFKELSKQKTPSLILDTPYRLHKTFEELGRANTNLYCVVGINLTCDDERIIYGDPSTVLKETSDLKKENFVCMVYPPKK